MNNYLFRFPENTPTMRRPDLVRAMRKQCDKAQCYGCVLEIGSTVTVRRAAIPTIGGFAETSVFAVRLYDLDIALIANDTVTFMPRGDDGHRATAIWLSKIASDNAICNVVGRVRRRKTDGPGVPVARGEAGLLTLGWSRERPVVGMTYPVRPIGTTKGIPAPLNLWDTPALIRGMVTA